jgi:ribosomal-protein-alanine N-acetyltransferase
MIKRPDVPEIALVPFPEERDNTQLKVDYLRWLNDLEVVRPIASPGLMQQKGPEFIDSSFERFSREDSRGFFIRYVPDSVYIGTAKLDGISQHTKSAWDGIMIGDRRYQGRGLAAKVYRVLLAHAFEDLGLRRINGGCNATNVAMVKTFLHLGYSQEGCLRLADCIDGKYSDHLYFGILRDEFIVAQRTINAARGSKA